MNVFEEEYWLPCHHFPNYEVSSMGRIRDLEFDEIVPQVYSRGELRAVLKYGPDEFRGAVWQMMYATFWQAGWGIGVTVKYRDDDPKNLSMFNLLFDKDEKPLLYRLDSTTGIWSRKRNNARRVRVIETGEILDSVPILADHIGGSANIIYMCLRGSQVRHKGLRYEWADDD